MSAGVDEAPRPGAARSSRCWSADEDLVADPRRVPRLLRARCASGGGRERVCTWSSARGTTSQRKARPARRAPRSGAAIPTPRGMPRRWSASTPGRIAAATMKPRKRSARTSFSFQSASAAATIRRRRASRRTPAWRSGSWGGPGRAQGTGNRRRRLVSLHVDAHRGAASGSPRRHAVVLVRPLARGFALGAVGFVFFTIGSPVMLVGAAADRIWAARLRAVGVALGADARRRHDGAALRRARDARGSAGICRS